MIESNPARIDNLSLVSAALSPFVGPDLISMGIVTATKGTHIGA